MLMFRVLVLPSAAALGMLISGSYFLVAHKQKSLCYLSHRRACLSFNFCCWSLIYRGILNLIFLGAWYLNLCKLVWSYLEPWRRRQAHSSVIRSLGNFGPFQFPGQWSLFIWWTGRVWLLLAPAHTLWTCSMRIKQIAQCFRARFELCVVGLLITTI